MEATLSAWGNSIGLRIPKTFIKMVGFTKNQKINLSVKDNTIVITPKTQKLSDILKKIPENYDPALKNDEWENVKPLGKEVW